MYTPLRVNNKSANKTAYSFMGKKGIDLRDLPQLLTPENALDIQNYFITADGGLIKRQGITSFDGVTGATAVSLLLAYTSDLLFYGSRDSLYMYRISTDASTLVKTYATASTYEGVRYGDYIFVTNKLEKIGRISSTLAYDAQTSNFTVGNVVTGSTSGATAIILEDSDSGATGTLTLGRVLGTFLDDELITGSSGGSATVNGVLGFTYTTVSAAPICQTLGLYGARLVAGGLSTDATAIQYSDINTTTNPPFSTWTIGTNASDGDVVNYRNAGAVRKTEVLGDNLIVWGQFGKWAVTVSTIDSGGTLKKTTQTVLQRQDFGGSRASCQTDKGVFYANKDGLWNLVSVGQSNIPFSEQENKVTLLLGAHYFDDIDLTDADMIFDPNHRAVLLTCAKDSDVNNFVIVYSLEFNAISFFTGWNISRFCEIAGQIYGASANTTTLYTVFDGYSDDGNQIWTKFYQEIKMGNLETRQELEKFYVQGFLSASTDITVAFDIYDKTGAFVANKTTWSWTPQSANNLSDGFGIASWGSSAWGGDVDLATAVECFDGAKVSINNFQRIRIRFESNDTLPHIINWFSAISKVKALIRRRKLTKLT